MNLSYEYYRVFYYAAKYRSITQAARALMSNQPNVTRCIKSLERELGCALFVRSSRGVTLTPEGEKLYDHVKIAVENILAGEEELALRRGLEEGIVSIGASEVALRCQLLPVLNQYRRRYPGVRIKIANHSTPQAVRALLDGLVDLAVVTTPMDAAEELQSILVREFRECAVCGESYRPLWEKPVSLARLSRLPLICLDAGTKTYAFYTAFFQRHGLVMDPDIEAATADQVLPMVRNNLGIGFVPTDFLQDTSESAGIHAIPLVEEIPPRAICLVKNKQRPLSVAARALEKMILDAREMPAAK